MRHSVFGDSDCLCTAITDANTLIGNFLVDWVVNTGIEGLHHADRLAVHRQFKGHSLRMIGIKMCAKPHIIDIYIGR